MDGLNVRLHRVLVEKGRAVAPAFDEIDPGDLGVPRQCVEVECQGLLDEAVNHQAMLGRIDVGESGAGHDEMQAGWSNSAFEKMVWGARVAGSRLVVGVGEGSDDLALVF